MSASPAHSLPVVGHAGDVFERLARSDGLLTAKELADILAISPKTLYSYVARNDPIFQDRVERAFSRPRGVRVATTACVPAHGIAQ